MVMRILRIIEPATSKFQMLSLAEQKEFKKLMLWLARLPKPLTKYKEIIILDSRKGEYRFEPGKDRLVPKFRVWFHIDHDNTLVIADFD